MTEHPSAASDHVADQVRYWRQERGLNREALAERCARSGMPEITAMVITNIESGRRRDGVRRRDITVDELLCFASALDVPIWQLLPAVQDQEPETLWRVGRKLGRTIYSQLLSECHLDQVAQRPR